MTKTVRVTLIILLIAVISLIAYSSFSGKKEILPYVQLLMGGLLAVLGVNEVGENHKGIGVFYFVLAGFSALAGVLSIVS